MLITICAILLLLAFAIASLISSTSKLHSLSWLAWFNRPSSAPCLRDSFISTEGGTRDGLHVAYDNEVLLSRTQCEALPETDWRRQAYEDIRSVLLARSSAARFPCIYATAGFTQNQHRYVFMPSEDPSQPSNIRLSAQALHAYLPQSRSLGTNTSLLMVHPPCQTRHTVDEYRKRFWTVLRGLRSCDRESWPLDIPTETHAAKWAFCFDGVPWFLAAMTPAHEQRQSRHASYFTIAVQPKWVFTELFKTPERRSQAVQAVRKLIPAYDKIGVSPDLSDYGSDGSTESHQYYLLDENETSRCPYKNLDAQ